MAGMCGVNMDGDVYTQLGIDIELASMVWELVNYLDEMEEKPKAFGIKMERDDEGKVHIHIVNCDDEDNEDVEAIITIEPIDEVGVEDEELKKVMQFMYFYQAIHLHTQKYELEG